MIAPKENIWAVWIKPLLVEYSWLIFSLLIAIVLFGLSYTAFKGMSTLSTIGIRTNADLSTADLRTADLQGADLQRANLSGANLTKANLLNADLTSARLRGAILTEANLQGTNLSGADLRDADLKGVNLASAINLSAEQIVAASLDEKTTLPTYLREALSTKFDISIAYSFDLQFEPYKVTVNAASDTVAFVGQTREVLLQRVMGGKPTEQELVTLSGLASFGRSVVISPDNKVIAAGSDDGLIKLWRIGETAPFKTINEAKDEGYVFSLDYTGDGQSLISASRNIKNEVKTVRVWRTSDYTSELSLQVNEKELIIDINPDPKLMLIYTRDQGVQVRPIAAGGISRLLEGSQRYDINNGAFSTDGEMVALGVRGNGRGALALWRIADNRQIRAPLVGPQGDVASVAFSPDRQLVAAGWSDGSIQLWRLSDGTQLTPLTGHNGDVQGLSFSPDGRLLVSIGVDKTVRFWNVVQFKFS